MNESIDMEKKKPVEKCEVCNANDFRYRCPRCEVRTCSLPCVTIHKKELECNGERSVTSYVPLSKFDNLNLLSDYRFLEDVDRTITNCRRNPQKRYTRYSQPLPTHLYRLKAAAAKRKIQILYLPQHFTRHKENKTILDYSTQVITWKIDFLFPQGEMIKISVSASEKEKLGSLLETYIDPVKCPDIYRSYLKYYHAAGMADIAVFLKAERSQDKMSVYELDLSDDINENLCGKLIIENPVIIVTRLSNKLEYNILDDDAMGMKKQPSLSGFFGEYNPIGFFDELGEKKKKRSRVEEAEDSLKASTRELRGLPIKEEPDPSCYKEPSPIQRKRRIHIPSYNELCST